MHKDDYNMIAKALRDSAITARCPKCKTDLESAVEYEDLVRGLARVFSAHSLSFDYENFLSACEF